MNEGSYYQPSVGSLTGFDAVELVNGNNDIVKLGWSVEQIREFLLNESDINFPTADWVRLVDDLINDHINNFNNPHKVTLDQVTSSFARDVLGSVTTGTPPSIPPFFAYDAACALPLNDVFPALFSSDNMLRMTEGSVFVAADDEINEMGVDCTTTKGGIPLFGPITNLVAPDWKSRFTAVLNTTITDSVRPLGNFPFSSYTVTEAAAYGEFAIGIASDREVGKSYTFTAFLRQTIVGGSVRITQMNNEANYMTVNLRDGSCTFTGTGIIGTAFVYPSGIIRVAFGFTTVSSMNPNLVKLTHIDDGASTPARNGTNRALFTIARPMISTSFLNHPTLEDEYTTGSTSVLTLALERIPAALALSDVMIAMSINMYPALPNQAVNDTTILSFGTLSITRADAILSVKNGNTVLFQQPILPGLNNLALSYSPTEIIFKSGISPRKVLTGAFPALLTQTVTVGRCGGYLRQMAMYAASDKAKAIEYLANG